MSSLFSFGGSRLPVVLFLAFSLLACSGPTAPQPPKLVGVTVDHAARRVPVGAEATMTATLSPVNAAAPAVTWTSSDTSVATVDSAGVLSALQTGTTQVTATVGAFTSVSTVTVTTPEVFITGYHTDDQVHTYAGVWVDGVWSSLAYDSTTYSSGSQAAQVSFEGGDVYVAGTLFDADYHQTGGYWKNGVWNPVAGEGSVAAAVAGGKVYLIGYTDWWTVPAYWVDGVKHNLPLDTTRYTSVYVNGLLVDGGHIWVSADLEDADTTRPGLWKDGVLSFLRLPAGYTNGSVGRPFRSGKDLYLPGMVASSDYSLKQVGYWKNGVWTGESATPAVFSVSGMAVRSGQIHVLSADYYAGGSPNSLPAEWVNGTKSLLTFGQSQNTGMTSGVALVGNDVYISGFYSDNYSTSGTPGYWKNGTWTALDMGVSDDSTTYDLQVR